MRGLPFRAAELAAVIQDVIDSTSGAPLGADRDRRQREMTTVDLGMPAEGPIADAIDALGGGARPEADRAEGQGPQDRPGGALVPRVR